MSFEKFKKAPDRLNVIIFQCRQNCSRVTISRAHYLNFYRGKKSEAFEATGSSRRSLSPFPYHETTRSISTPPGRDASPLQITPQQFVRFSPTIHRYSFILLGGERHCESKGSCPRTQHKVPGQGSHPDRSIRGRAH